MENNTIIGESEYSLFEVNNGDLFIENSTFVNNNINENVLFLVKDIKE